MSKVVSSASICQEINALLFLNDCVIIPELGAFVASYKPAHYNSLSNALNMPGKCIVFNKRITLEDGLLTGAIMKRNGLFYEEAKQEVLNFVRQIQIQLHEQGAFQLEGLGQFKLDNNHQMIFESNQELIPTADTFGLRPIFIHPVLRPISRNANETEKKIFSIAPSKEEHKQQRKIAGLRYFIIPTIAASVFLFLSIFSPFMEGVPLTNFSLINSSVAVTPHLKTVEVKKINIYKTRKSKQQQTISNFMLETAKFYPVASSFASAENAHKMVEELKEMGFNASIVDRTHGGLYRVSYGSFTSFTSANRELDAIRKTINPDAWLLIK